MSSSAVERYCHYCRKILGDSYFIIDDEIDDEIDETGYRVECCAECRYKFWDEESTFWNKKELVEIFEPIKSRFEILDL